MNHSSPYSNPEKMEEFDSVYKSMAIFIMPSGEMGSWDIDFEITTSTNQVVSGALDIEVNSSWKINNVRSESGTPYFITWYAPGIPATGNQELNFISRIRRIYFGVYNRILKKTCYFS